MQIQERKLETIRPYPNNPRRNDEAVQAVAASIREFGWKQPIVVDRDGVIIVGHTRYKAAQELGLEKVPVLVADDLTEEQARAYRLADNKVAEFSFFDTEKLTAEIGKVENIDMEQFGEIVLGMPDYSDLFSEADPKEKEPKTMTCPCCGGTFEL